MSPGEAIGEARETLEVLAGEWEMSLDERHKLFAEIEEFGMRLADTYFRHAEVIDGSISTLSHEWALERMPAIDRNILRMAAAEILYFPDVPGSAAINEAVELAKDYGTTESGKFVNGILGALARKAGLSDNKLDAAGELELEHTIPDPPPEALPPDPSPAPSLPDDE